MARFDHYLVVGPDRTRFRLPSSEAAAKFERSWQVIDENFAHQVDAIAEDGSEIKLYLNKASAPWWYIESHPAD